MSQDKETDSIFCVSTKIFKCDFSNSGFIKSYRFEDSELKNKYQEEWCKYWLQYGDEIINLSWINQYGCYLGLYLRNISFSNKWEQLWEDHYKQQYAKCFHNWFQTYYKTSIKLLNIKNVERCNDNIDYVEIDQSEELQKLGLPTNFSSKKTKNFLCSVSKTDIEREIDISQANSCKQIKHCIEMEELQNVANDKKNKQNFRLTKSTCDTKNKRKKNSKLKNIPSIANDKEIFKYWRKRFILFSKFEQGIQLDKESWFSVTPEKIAVHISERMKSFDIIVDAFCGCGGNTIQFARKCKKVIAIDIDPQKIAMAKNNAKIYEVEHKIEFIVGDFLLLNEKLKANGIFLSPPWGGPNYSKIANFDIEKHLQPTSASILLEKARTVSSNISIFLPRNANVSQIISLAGNGNKVQIEKNYLGDKVVALTAFYGNIIS